MTIALNWIDYGFITLFAFSIIMGLGRGFVKEIISLLMLIAAIYIAITFSSQLANYFAGNTNGESHPVSNLMLTVSFLVLFVGTVLIGAIVGYLLNAVFQFGVLGFTNRFMGALFGFARAVLFSVVIVFVVQLTEANQNPTWQESKFVGYFQPWADWLSKNYAPAMEEVKAKMTTSQ